MEVLLLFVLGVVLIISSLLYIIYLLKKPKNKIQNKTRFESWEEAKLYLGKEVITDLVESPNVEGYLTGIFVDMETDFEETISMYDVKYKVREGYLEIDGRHRFNYWNCKPKNWINEKK